MRRRPQEQPGSAGGGGTARASEGKGGATKKGPSRRGRHKGGSWLPSIPVLAGVGLTVSAALAAVGLYVMLRTSGEEASENLRDHLAPFPGPKVTDLPLFGGKYKEEMLWGTYRPHLYLGIRARVPQSLLAGVMWIAPKADAFEVRHKCQQHDKVLKTYGWLRHNARSYGRQRIVDGPFHLTTFFVKSAGDEGSGYGGDWVVRLMIQSKEPPPPNPEEQRAVSFFFYIAEESGKPINVMPEWRGAQAPEGLSEAKSGVLASGVTEPFGAWELHFHLNRTGPKNLAWEGMRVRHFHNLSDPVALSLARQYKAEQGLYLPHKSVPGTNLAILQVTLHPPAEADFVFVSAPRDRVNPENMAQRVASLTGSLLDKRITEEEEAFDTRFSATFPIPKEVAGASGADEAAKAALSNLLGGMGYFFGRSRVAVPKGQPQTDPFWLYWPAALFTAVPSRSFFPRGFLWDEGFHQLIIRKWDAVVSMDAMAHWLDLLNANGWIPREQILGEEAQSFVPEEFILQHTDNGNPPTLFLPLSALASQALESPTTGDVVQGTASQDDVMSFLERALPRLQRWFRWFNSTQKGELPGSYFWHGRDTESTRELNPKTLQSGLDDYPRASHPGPTERHLDLRCWLALAASLLSSIRRSLGTDRDGLDKLYANTEEMLTDVDLLHKLHWDNETETFADYGNHTEDVRLARVEWVDQQSGTLQRSMERVVGTAPVPSFVPQFGYVSLFPLLLRLLPPNSPSLGRLLGRLRSEELLWTAYGLRSLAANSSMFMKHNTEHDPPYWRGPIWININYLALSALHHYSQVEGPYQEQAASLYQDLRTSVMRNIVKQHRRSGFLWEQYDSSSGRGKGSHPFTGWTALVVLIASEQYQ